MPSIGNLFARLGLDNSELERKAKESEKTIGGLGDRLRGLVNRAGAVGVSLGAVGTALAVNLVQRGGEAAREIRNLAQLSQTSTREFQRQAHAARQFGIEQEKLSDIYKDATDRVGDFLTTGGGPMADFFDQIAPKVGVTADEFRGLTGPDVLQKYVATLEEANVSQAEMTFFLEAMASDSARLLPLLTQNATELNRLGDEAEQLGIVLSDIELDRLIDGKEALDRLGASLSSVSRVATSTLAPAIQAIAEGIEIELKEALSDSKGDILDWGDVAGDVLAFVADAAVGAVKVIGSGFDAVGQTIGAGAAEAVARVTGETEEADAIAAEWRANMAAIGASLTQDSSFTVFRDRLAAIREEMERMEGISEIEIRVGRRGANIADREAAEAEAEAAQQQADRMAEIDRERLERQAEREREFLELRLQMLREHVMSAAEIEQKRHDERLTDLQAALEAGLIVESEFLTLREDLEAEHMDRLQTIREQGMTELERITESSFANQAGFVAKYLADMTAGVASESRAMFEINKVAGIANALLDAKESILGSYKVGSRIGGPPLGAAFAAVAAATTAAQVQAISSTSFGSGGGAAPSVAGTTAAPPVSPVGGGSTGPQRVIAIEGLSPESLFSGQAVRSLLEGIQDEVDDGATLVFPK